MVLAGLLGVGDCFGEEIDWTGSPGVQVKLEDTIKGFQGLIAGEFDHLPEQAFYMVGNIDEAKAKAAKMTADAA